MENFDYENSDSGKNHKELIDEVKKFINDGNEILKKTNQPQNKIIQNDEEEEIFEDDKEEDRDI